LPVAPRKSDNETGKDLTSAAIQERGHQDIKKRRNNHARSKARVALDVVKGERTVSELAAECGVHHTIIHHWKKGPLHGAADIFERGGKAAPAVGEDAVRWLHAKIGGAGCGRRLFHHESSSLGSAIEARDDGQEPPKSVSRGAMPPAVDLAVVVLLRTDG
jgi:hypothetical protein